jgi:hypothetical protein
MQMAELTAHVSHHSTSRPIAVISIVLTADVIVLNYL